MMYAFARDGGIPGHTFFHKVDAKRKSPVRTGALLFNLPEFEIRKTDSI